MRFPPLLLSLAILLPQPASAGALKGVTACDMRRLATWHGSQAKAKRALRQVARGSKIIDTPRGPMAEGVYYEVEAARKVPMDCTFAEAGYSYDDSVLLARVWGMSDPAQARAFAEQKIAVGYEDGIVWALSDAKAGKLPQEPSPDEEAMSVFLTGDRYTACDARLLAAQWQIDLYSAKVTIGHKLRNRDVGGLEAVMGPARHAAIARRETCDFWETGYSYEDAQKLATSWGTTVPSAKARIADMVLRGQNPALRDMLRDAR